MEKPVQGLDRDLAEKAAAKYDPKREADAREYIETITNEKFSSDNFQESLKDGVLLCKLMNIILPSDPIKVSTSRIAFKQMENIGFFLNRLSKVGVPTYEQFQTVDLYEGKNIDQVVNCIFSLSRHASAMGFDGPVLGPKLSAKVERNFTEEQLNQSKSMLPRLTNFTAKMDGPGPFGGRREIGGTYLDTPTKATSDEIAEEVAKVTIEEPIVQTPVVEAPIATPVAPARVTSIAASIPVAAPVVEVAPPAPIPASIPEPVYVPSPAPVSAYVPAPAAAASYTAAAESDSAFDKLDRIVREAEEEIQRAKEVAAASRRKEDEERQAHKARIAAHAISAPAPPPVIAPPPVPAPFEDAVVSPSAIADSYIDSYYQDDDDVEEVVIVEDSDDDEGKVMYGSGTPRREE